MKILSVPAIKKADEVTIQKQGLTSYELMERAAKEIFLRIKRRFPDKETVFHVFCGQGNNGGDGLLVAIQLKADGYTTYLNAVQTSGNFSPDAALAQKATEGCGLTPSPEISSFGTGKAVVIDAIFGIGLSRELNGPVRQAIEMINISGAAVVSIDVPSGMFMDRPTEFAVKSNYLLTIQFPKLAFYLPGNYRFINEIEVVDIGLDSDYIQSAAADCYLTSPADAYRLCKPVPRYAHKGTQGHALIIGGSHGKTGAAILCAKAALKSGCGLVTAYLPECGYHAIQSAFPEAMALTNGDRHIAAINYEVSPSAIAIGPGLGQEPETQQAVRNFLKLQQKPLVIDADALNILSYNKDMLHDLPAGSVLTPHPKELERLIGAFNDDFEKLEKIRAFSKKHDVVVVSKNAHTMVVYHDKVHVNPTGNAALATGGSGDVLTGIVTGLLAQGYTPPDAAVLAVYLHGLSADIGIKDLGARAFTASDILAYLGAAYLKVESAC